MCYKAVPGWRSQVENCHEVEVGVDLVLHRVEVAGEPVLGPGVVLHAAAGAGVLSDQGGLEVNSGANFLMTFS